MAEKDKAIMEQRLLQYQEEIRLANEALVSIHIYLVIIVHFISDLINIHQCCKRFLASIRRDC